MAFTRGLFYPWINIADEAWLKTAMLYWDRLQTIVPTSIRWPYQTEAARAFHQAGLLTPFAVEPGMADIEGLSTEVLRFLESPEGLAVLAGQLGSRRASLHRDKLSRQVRELVELHSAKIPDVVFQHLVKRRGQQERGAFITVDRGFAAYYMTLLANRICEQHGLGPVTYDPAADWLATTAKLNSTYPSRQPYWHQPHHAIDRDNPLVPATLAQALSVTIVLEKVTLDPQTPVDKILRFRHQYNDELGRFRAQIGELTSCLTGNYPLEALRRRVEDLYTNQIQPAYNDLKSSLKSNRIEHVAENAFKVWGVTAPASSIPTALMHLPVPLALAASAGFSVVAGVVWYNREKRDLLRASPYAYLFRLESKLRPRKRAF